VPGDQKLADSVHTNSDMHHVCLQLLAADCQARSLSNSCSVHSQQQQTLGSCWADWRTQISWVLWISWVPSWRNLP